MARLVLTEGASQNRRYVEGGVASRYESGLSDFLQNTDLTITGFGGTSTTRAGSYSTNIFRGSLGTQPTAVCGTGLKTHIGTFRVIGRMYVAPASGNPGDVHIRFSYQDGSGVFRAGSFASSPVANAWGRVDLGTINLTQALQGTQQWSGRIEAYSTAAGDTVDVDFLVLYPAETYFKVRAAYQYNSGVQVARDEFTGMTALAALNARAAPVGGTWATSGATNDFAAPDVPPTPFQGSVGRSSISDTGSGRFAILGATNYTDVEVGMGFTTRLFGATYAISQSVLARYVDASNYAVAEVVPSPSGATFYLRVVVAGVATNLALQSGLTVPSSTTALSTLRIVCYATGHAVAQYLDAGGGLVAQLAGTHTALATGGALATGKPGIRDLNTAGVVSARVYDNFYVATPAAEPIAIYSGKQAEMRETGYIRQDASSVWGPLVARGRPFVVQPAGGPGRSNRIVVMAHRNDLEVAEWSPVNDSLTAQLIYTPMYEAVPR